MATPPRDDDSDHEDHGSVITYRDDDDDPVISSKTLNTAPQVRSAGGEHHVQIHEPVDGVGEHPKDTSFSLVWFRLRAFLADLCDHTAWEFSYVILTIVFVCLTIAEVSIFVGPIGSFQGLRGLSGTSAAILGAFTFEVVCKTLAYDLGFWRVPRNVVESAAVLVAFAIEVAATVWIFTWPTSFETAQLMVSSRVFRLVVCVLRQRRTREFLVAMRAIRSLNDDSLSTPERTMEILREIKTKYPLSDVHQVQLQWCINVIASHRLYTGFFRGPNGEPIRFSGVDEDTSKWLLRTYTQTKEDEPPSSGTAHSLGAKQTTPPKEPERKRNTGSPVLGSSAGVEKLNSPSLSASAPNVLRPVEGKLSRQLSRKDTDGSDSLLSGRRHTPLYLSSDKATTMQEVATDAAAPSPGNGNSPTLAHKRTLSKGNMVLRAADHNQSASARRGSTLRRGSSFANHTEPLVDLEEGLSFGGQSVNQARIVTGASLGLVAGDVDFLQAAVRGRTSFEKLNESLDRINRELDEWTFDIFFLDELTQGRPLSPCLIATMRKNNVFDVLGSCLSVPVVMNFCLELENGYDPTNPYHNRIHAADVVQCFHHFLTHRQFRDSVTPLDRFLGLIAAAVHDFRHPGVNNTFLVNTRDAIAVQYNDISVLENMHVASAFEVMRSRPDLDVLAGLPVAARAEARETIIQMVLATDMKAHFDILSQFKNQMGQVQVVEKTHENLGSWWHELFPVDRDVSFSSTASSSGPLTAYPLEYRRVIMKTALHVADVSNPARPNALTIRWADLVQEEFFRQGDREREAGLPISMFMDRTKPTFPKMQVGFIEFIVKPLAEAFGGWLKTLRPCMDPHLASNLDYWKKRQEAEAAASALSPSTAIAPSVSSTPTVATPLSQEQSKAPSRLVARLKSGASTKHRSSGSLGEATPMTGTADSPLQQGVKRPLPIRRTTSETLVVSGSPSLTSDPATKRSPLSGVSTTSVPLVRSSLNVETMQISSLASPASNDSDTTNVTG